MEFRDENFGKDLLTTIMTADGLILTLGWGLFDWTSTSPLKNIFLCYLKWGSTFLAASLISGILCFQFMVSSSQKSQSKQTSVMSASHVSISFLISWVSFLIGIVIFVVGIWRI